MTTVELVVRPDAVDAQWLTETLRRAGVLSAARVTSFERSVCGTGQLADSYRFALTYDPPGAGPATVVGKFSSDDPISRAWGQGSGQYRNEIRFYQELATRLECNVPTPIHAELAANETDFVLLMEDLGPARIVDQLDGCTVDEAALVIEQMAILHAGSWHDAALAETEWLKVNIAAWRTVTDEFAAALAAVPESFAELVSEADLAQASRLMAHQATWKRIMSEPRCLWHNDLRADNVMFDAQGGDIPAALVDWQGATYACGTLDLAYFVGTSLTTELRRAHERDLVADYHAGLVAHGVSGYTLEDCWNDYRLLAIHPLQTGIFGIGAVKRSERGDRMWRNWVERSAQMTRDLDSFTVLAER